jgi:putative flippase GtrA
MKSKLKVLKDKYFDWSMLRWLLVGLFTTATDYLIFISLYSPIDSVVIANFISGFVSTSINYYTRHRWTFKSEQEHSKSGSRYFLNLIFWWVVSTLKYESLNCFRRLIQRLLSCYQSWLSRQSITSFLNYIVFKKKG